MERMFIFLEIFIDFKIKIKKKNYTYLIDEAFMAMRIYKPFFNDIFTLA